jgi:hypothetical protein
MIMNVYLRSMWGMGGGGMDKTTKKAFIMMKVFRRILTAGERRN